MSTATSREAPPRALDDELARLLDHALKRADRLGLDLVAVRIAHALDELGGATPAIAEAARRG